jgi:putative membrane protein
MSKVEIQVRHEQRSLLKGMLAGLAGGLAAMAVKTAAEKFYARKMDHSALAQRLPERMGQVLTAGEELAAAESIHWGIGAAAGAAYGGVAEYFPAATAKDGASFGLTLATVAQKLSGDPETEGVLARTSGMAAHVVFGLVTETVRRFVRKRL